LHTLRGDLVSTPSFALRTMTCCDSNSTLLKSIKATILCDKLFVISPESVWNWGMRSWPKIGKFTVSNLNWTPDLGNSGISGVIVTWLAGCDSLDDVDGVDLNPPFWIGWFFGSPIFCWFGSNSRTTAKALPLRSGMGEVEFVGSKTKIGGAGGSFKSMEIGLAVTSSIGSDLAWFDWLGTFAEVAIWFELLAGFWIWLELPELPLKWTWLEMLELASCLAAPEIFAFVGSISDRFWFDVIGESVVRLRCNRSLNVEFRRVGKNLDDFGGSLNATSRRCLVPFVVELSPQIGG